MTSSLRPSHALPRPIFDALLELEVVSRRSADSWRSHQNGGDTAEDYMASIAACGTQRDYIAALILAAVSEAALAPRE